MAVVSHYNVAPVIEYFRWSAGRDLGGVAGDINKVIDAARSNAPWLPSRGSRQVQTMRSSYIGLLTGIGVRDPPRLSADCGQFSSPGSIP